MLRCFGEVVAGVRAGEIVRIGTGVALDILRYSALPVGKVHGDYAVCARALTRGVGERGCVQGDQTADGRECVGALRFECAVRRCSKDPVSPELRVAGLFLPIDDGMPDFSLYANYVVSFGAGAGTNPLGVARENRVIRIRA